MSDHVWVKAGDKVFDQGDPGDCMYVVTKGLVRIVRRTTRGDMTLAELGTGEFFGEMAILTGERRSARAEAVNDASLMSFQANEISNLIRSHPDIAERMIRTLAKRIVDTTNQLVNIMEKARRD